MKLCLGTVQFGLNYGIAGGIRQDIDKSIEIMQCANENGICAFDTAPAYGNAEYIVGQFLKKSRLKRDLIDITTKTPPFLLDRIEAKNYYNTLLDALEISLKKLNQEYVDCYMIHTSSYVQNPEIIDACFKLVETQKVKRIGISIYTPDQALLAAQNKKIASIQIPYNIADSRLDKCGFFERCIDKTVFARSAFLQGLLLMPINMIPNKVKMIKPYLKDLELQVSKYNLSRLEITVGYLKNKKNIDYMVFGVDNLAQLDDVIKAFNCDIEEAVIDTCKTIFLNIDNYILDPSGWTD